MPRIDYKTTRHRHPIPGYVYLIVFGFNAALVGLFLGSGRSWGELLIGAIITAIILLAVLHWLRSSSK